MSSRPTSKKTLVIGASENPERYSYKATMKLRKYGHEVIAFGLKSGMIGDTKITNHFPSDDAEIHTITLYLGPARQIPFYDLIIDLAPQRVIFNPGTENHEFYSLLDKAGIVYEEACTLVLLSTGEF